jgi:hypothetical protein
MKNIRSHRQEDGHAGAVREGLALKGRGIRRTAAFATQS